MTDILCKWLNNDVKLSKTINADSFAADFSNGFFIGEILNKHGLQDDFTMFSQSKQAAAKVNNFTRIEPMVNLLEVPFNTNIAREIMQENRVVTTQVLYQLYIALTNKNKRNLTGAALETMRPAAPVKLEQFESKIYQRQLKAKTPRQTDLDLTALRARYEKYKIEQEAIAFDQKYQEEERQRDELQNKRQYLIEKSKKYRLQQAEIAAKIKPYLDGARAAVVQIPKTPPKYKKEAILERRRLFDRNEGENALKDIMAFEKRIKTVTSNRDNADNEMTIVDLEEGRPFDEGNDSLPRIEPIEYLKPKSNDDYISKIRNRLQEDAHARKEREKRRRKVLVDQLKANEALEEAKREESLVTHMLRQSQFERRIAVELLHARHEKDVIRENCIAKEREIEERRAKEFYEALERERELARLAKLEYIDQAQKDKEWHDLIAADRAAAKYNNNFEMCKAIVNQIVDLTCKTGEYRNLTDNLIPPKIWRDWITLFRAGLPLYDEKEEIVIEEKVIKPDEETMKLLDECDFFEYKNMIGDWEPNESNGITVTPQDNRITGYIVNRLHSICFPVQPGAPAPLYPKFPLKAIVLGKPFAGKSAALQILEKETGTRVINAQQLINEAIEAFKRNPVIIDETEASLTEEQTSTREEKPVPQPAAVPAVEEKKPEEKKSSDDQKKLPPGLLTEKSKTKSDLKKKKSDKDLKPVEPEPEPEFVPPEDDLMVRRLGQIALTSLNSGEPVKDEIVVHIISEQIKRLPKEKGWIIDGFPLTYNQSKLLEKALSGYDDDKPYPVRPKNESVLAPNPRPDPPPSKHNSSIDVIIHLEVSNENVLKRSAGRFCGTISQSLYHQQFKPPPEGSFTGLNRNELVEPVRDISNDMEQLQHRITAFEDNWGKVVKFYEKYSKVEKIITDDINEGTLAIEIHRALDDFVEQREKKKRDEIERKAAEEAAQKELLQKLEEEKAKKKLEEEAAELAKRLEAEKAAREAAERSQSPPKSTKGKKGAKSPKAQSPVKSAKKSESPKPAGKGKKTPPPAAVAPPPEPEVAVVKPEEPKPPEPGSEEWQYVEERLNILLARLLCNQWDVVENSYVENAKYVFRKIRVDREDIIYYFFNIKNEFKDFLRRPDTKQEFIDAFVKMYNSIPDDIRDDEEVKAELHQRVEDLKDQLWSICDKKKEDAEKERELVMSDGWLDDKLGLLNNHYITLIQAELDRFLDTGRMLKDYYKCMQAPIPDEMNSEYPRLPLIDLKTDLNAENQEVATDRTGDSGEKPKSPKSPRTKSPKSPTSAKKAAAAQPVAAAAAGKKGKKTPELGASTSIDAGTEEVKEKKQRIPLIPRRQSSADREKEKKAASKKPKNPEEMSPIPPEDPDEKLIFDAHKKANAYVTEFMMNELGVINADEDGSGGGAGTGDAGKGAKGPKLGKVVIQKSRSPSAKAKSPKGSKGAKGKGGKEEAPPEAPAAPVSDEERKKRKLKEKMRKEYWAALQKEEAAFKARTDAIKAIAIKVIQDLKQKGNNSYKEMNDWLGSRWMKEMDSIKVLIEVIKHSIENKEKVKQELVLQQEDFFIDTEIVVLRSPTPPRRPEPVEIITPEYFPIDSLHMIHDQFRLVAPEGLVAVKTFADIYSDLATLNYGTEILPENWSNLSQHQVDSLAKMLANGSEFVDWKHWLLFASAPWPFPTQTQLLNQLEAYKMIDSQNSGFITVDEFLDTPLWFRLQRPPTPPDLTQPAPYDRFTHLLEFWFELFAQPVQDGLDEVYMLNYKNMLVYMSATPDPYEGFLRALSVSQENQMPRIDLKTQMKVPTFYMTQEYEQYKQNTLSEKYPNDQLVAIDSLYRVFHHGERQRGDTHRFAATEDPEDFMSMERILNIYNELDEDSRPEVQYSKLVAHPVLCEMISNCTKFRSPDFRTVFNMQSLDDEFQDRRTPND